ncbi:uncharacterized protein LOC123565442 [Mercenaria mercenaria]|uniref:uncharacterized protein LOC123565442 n=1 Tax=Mercenaria mercenaria TaxID=6596 RepID=UPI00234F7668|nr:uncharacterized protein LOC123565442 [Mercenaria mercenaria]
MSKLNRDRVAFNDRTLISIQQKYYVQPPSVLPYNLSHFEIQNPSPGQTQFIDEYLNQKRNGFYIDCGAFDGEHLSNSLFLERYRNWTGILIEPNPTIYRLLRQKHRKAYSLNACLSTNKYPSLVSRVRTKRILLVRTWPVTSQPAPRLGKVVAVCGVHCAGYTLTFQYDIAV